MTAALAAVAASLELVKEQLEACRKAIDKPSIVDNYQEYLLGMHIYTMINNASVALEILSEMGITPTPSPVAMPRRYTPSEIWTVCEEIISLAQNVDAPEPPNKREIELMQTAFRILVKALMV